MFRTQRVYAFLYPWSYSGRSQWFPLKVWNVQPWNGKTNQMGIYYQSIMSENIELWTNPPDNKLDHEAHTQKKWIWKSFQIWTLRMEKVVNKYLQSDHSHFETFMVTRKKAVRTHNLDLATLCSLCYFPFNLLQEFTRFDFSAGWGINSVIYLCISV